MCTGGFFNEVKRRSREADRSTFCRGEEYMALSLHVSIRHYVALVSVAPHLSTNQCRTQRFPRAAYCLWFRQGRWTVPGGRTAVGLGARGCSAAATLPPSWCEVSRPYSPLLCAKTLRSLRRNLALRFWNQTCKRTS